MKRTFFMLLSLIVVSCSVGAMNVAIEAPERGELGQEWVSFELEKREHAQGDLEKSKKRLGRARNNFDVSMHRFKGLTGLASDDPDLVCRYIEASRDLVKKSKFLERAKKAYARRKKREDEMDAESSRLHRLVNDAYFHCGVEELDACVVWSTAKLSKYDRPGFASTQEISKKGRESLRDFYVTAQKANELKTSEYYHTRAMRSVLSELLPEDA